ncbi:hypothetical protein BDB01DRAFT_805608 [Pilobolus umbonatus]|nr:hypothetical protein BDB01DRAFT_805608 [Pilobolus umbonatus]
MFDDIRYITFDIAVCLFNLMLNLFFREIRPRGSHRIPKEGPVIFVVAPHANQFLDPTLVIRECHRRVSFLIAEKSMHQAGIGFFARMINAIPIIRPQDRAVKGIGKAHLLDFENDPLLVTGVDTKFSSQFCPKDSIAFPGDVKAEVMRVISDSELLLKKPLPSMTPFIMGPSVFKVVPHIEQSAVYSAVYDELNRGGCITIFPEGGSHDQTEMLPLKVGVTIMAMGAMSKYPGLDIKIVPVGLNYFHAHKFRSRAVIEFGNPLTVPGRYIEMFENGGEEKREACSKLLSTIYDALKSVTLNAETYETLMLIQAARRLYKPAHRKLKISQVVDLNRRFLIGYNLVKDEPKVKDVEQRVLAYNQLLKYHGLKDHQVSKTELGGFRTLFLLIKRVILLAILLLWDFPGAILNMPIVVVAQYISAKKAEDALKSSTVKVAARDVLATWKVLVGLVLIPCLYTFYSMVVFVVLMKTTDLSFKAKFGIAVFTWIFIAGASYASILSGEIGIDIAKSLKPILMSLLDPSGAEILRQTRSVLSADITDIINEYGPKIYSDFDSKI